MKLLGALLASFFVLLIAVVLAVIAPLLYAIGRGFTGWVLTNVFSFAGQWVVDGAKFFGLNIPLGDLPYVGAFLGFLGSFFKTSVSKSESKS